MNTPTFAQVDFKGDIAFSAQCLSETEATGSMDIQDGIRNPFGTVHAGALIWFADVVATTLCLHGVRPEQGMKGFPLAINLSANLLSNTREGTLTARAEYVKKGRQVSTVRTIVETDAGKQLLDMTTTHIAST